MTKNCRGKRGRPANEALGLSIVSAARDLFEEFGFQATTMEKVAQRAKISKLSIYKHFKTKDALFSAAVATCCQQLIPETMFEEIDGSAAHQLMIVGSSLLRTFLSPTFRGIEAMIIADKTNHKSLSKLHYEAGPAHVIRMIEDMLRKLHANGALYVPDPPKSARLFAAIFKGSDLSNIVRFDEATAENQIESYCCSAVSMFIAAHRGNDLEIE